MIRFGIISLFLSIALIVAGFVLVLATDSMLEPLSPFLCPTDQSLSRETSSFRGETNVFFYCVNDDGIAQKEITGWIVLTMFVLFVPMVISILLIVAGAQRKARRVVGGALNLDDGAVIVGGVKVKHSQEILSGSFDDLGDALEPLIAQARQMRVNVDEPTLREKLQQLKDAYDAGLINKWEFDDRKQQVLDDLTE